MKIFRVEFDLESLRTLPYSLWRIPACMAGFVNLVYSVVYIGLCIAWLYNEYKLASHSEGSGDKMWLILALIGAAIYIPFNLLAIFYSIRLIKVTAQEPVGGIDKNYDAVDEAEDKLQIIFSWRHYNIVALVLGFITLLLCLFMAVERLKALIHCVILCAMLAIVKKHIEEIQEFIESKERTEKIKNRRKSQAMIDMIRMLD